MKFSLIAKGTKAEESATFRYYDKDVAILIRPLSQLEEIDVIAAALKTCKEKGAEGKPGNAIYEAVRMAATLAVACLDPDSPPGARQSVFDLGAEQVLAELDTDTIAQLAERQDRWQEQCSPSFRHKTVKELFEMARKLGEDEHDPLAFARLSPNTQLVLARFMAALLRQSRASSSSPTSPFSRSATTSESSETESPKEESQSDSPTNDEAAEDSGS